MLSIADRVRRVGWAVPAVFGDETGPAWVYTVGIWHSCGGPELAMFGGPVEGMTQIVNLIGQRIADGGMVAAGEQVEDVCGYPLAIRPVHQSWRMTSMFAVSDSFYGWVRPPYLQVVWPDRGSRFPWERGFDAGFREDQPLLWLPRDDHPPGHWTRIDDPP
jgi:hypothetical protein